jgi:hypothetical protein
MAPPGTQVARAALFKKSRMHRSLQMPTTNGSPPEVGKGPG